MQGGFLQFAHSTIRFYFVLHSGQIDLEIDLSPHEEQMWFRILL